MTTAAATAPETADLPASGSVALAARPSVPDTLHQTMTLAWRALIKMRRNVEQFFDVTVQPLLFTAMFAFLFGGAVTGQHGSDGVKAYLPMIITGILGQTVLTACIATGTQLREDMDKGVFDRFKVLPIARIAPLAGPMVADLVRYLIASTLTFATGFALGYRPDGGVPGVIASIALAMIAGWSLAWVFTWVGTIGKNATSVQGISMIIMFPLTFMSNAFVPTDTMPKWLETFANVNPVSHVISAIRDLANNGQVTGEVGWALLGCAIVVAIFAPLSVRSFNKHM